jgi:hypothetical protein
MQLALRRALGMCHWTTCATALCPYHGDRAAAHADDRATATHHAITCPSTGLLASTSCHHNVAANGVVMALQSAGPGVPASAVRREQMSSCFDGPGAMSARAAPAAINANKTFRMDLVISAGALARARRAARSIVTRPSCSESTSRTNPAAVSHIAAHSDSTAGVAAAAGEKSKRTKCVVAHGVRPAFSSPS